MSSLWCYRSFAVLVISGAVAMIALSMRPSDYNDPSNKTLSTIFVVSMAVFIFSFFWVAASADEAVRKSGIDFNLDPFS